LKEILAEREIAAGMIGPDGVKPRGPMEGFADVALAVGDLTAGFIMPEARLMLVTDREIFGRYKRRHVYRKIYKGTPVRSATEIGRGRLTSSMWSMASGSTSACGARRSTARTST
jgi:transcription-repair coupling factor (superfamily II helicase)